MQLSQKQEKTIATALTIVAVLVIIAAILGVFWVLSSFLRTFSHVFLPIAVSGVAALVFQPYYDWLRFKLRLPIPAAVAALFLSVLIPISVFIGFFGVILTQQLTDAIRQLPEWWERLGRHIEMHLPEVQAFFTEHPAGQKAAQLLEGMGPMLATGLEYFAATSAQATRGLAGWLSALLHWAVAPVYFVFFIVMPHRDVSILDNYLPFLKEDTRKDVVFLVREFVTIMVAFFRGQIIIAFLQGVLLAIGFSIVGLQYGLVLGFLLGFLNVIPYLGSMLGLAITLPLAFFQDGGGPLTLLFVVAVFTIVQTIEGYVLTPKIMGNRTGLHPMAIIFAVFFWGAALDGILGMILAIPLTAFLVVFWRLAKDKYISEVV